LEHPSQWQGLVLKCLAKKSLLQPFLQGH